MRSLTRRHLMGAGAAGVTGGLWWGGAPAPAVAGDAFGEGGNPPFYRTRVGAAEITVVSDGKIGFPPSTIVPEVPEEEIEAFLLARHQPTDNVPLQLNAMVVDTGGRRVLIDAGCGAKLDPSAGRLPDNLLAAGIELASIDAVVVTHLHPDHLRGATDADNAAPVFANAEFVTPERELDFWNDPELPGQMPEGLFRWVAEGTFAHLRRLEERLRPVAAAGEAAPGVRFIPTPGHTPGHASVALESEGAVLMSTGDIVGDAFIGFEMPDAHFGLDWDPEAGVASRRAFLEQAAAERTRVFGFHLPWPGFGRVARQGDAFRWIPERWVWDA